MTDPLPHYPYYTPSKAPSRGHFIFLRLAYIFPPPGETTRRGWYIEKIIERVNKSVRMDIAGRCELFESGFTERAYF
jgi:hypothetical protein